MRLPGRAWLELSAEPAGQGGARYRQRAVFEPHGLAGHLYWRSVAPFHNVVFGGMARNITGAAARQGPAVPHRMTPCGALTSAVAGQEGWRRRAGARERTPQHLSPLRGL